ncbi:MULTISPECIES: globin-coupled sensor protein [unclassified Aureimonas]|uniref:globin-coupled sensor protein n=1 Tax=unclassified Aureimonas TaxID=2615206 RepID=UPI0006FAEBA1|nr:MULTISPECIES: globin-coupled sensor protein [unclassified Aureimonas]KQT64464.1 hypothetical protein ASG62_05795 [Aureimonas sp. Leaf427]KQT81652.1 hypothetical protein ASG54_03075 [Aureimonas sp. Leaf460]
MNTHETDSLSERLDFIGLDTAARERLRTLKPAIADGIGPALDAFYAKARANPHTRRFFSDEAHIASAKSRQMKHWGIIADADYDASYVAGVSTVGRVHAKLGLEPRWYIGGYALILEGLIGQVVEKRWPSRFGRKGSKTLADELSSVVKAALLDMDYAVSVYLDTLEADRKKAEAAKAETDEAQRMAMEAFGAAFQKLRSGDLGARAPSDLSGSFGAMAETYNDAVAALEEVLGQVVQSVGTISDGLSEISVASNDLSQRTEQQAASLEETVAALSEVTRGINQTAGSAGEAQATAAAAQKNAEKGGEIVGRAVEAMSQIEQSSDKIGQIIGVIDEIAFQTNLLALNAGVEAARAGEAGRGFAVVAQEVRGLAQRSAEAAKEIKTLISASAAQVGRGVELVSASGRSLEEILAGVSEMNRVVSDIARTAREQSLSLKEVSTAADQMDKVTQQNAAMVEETTAAAQHLASETETLSQLTLRFNLATSARSTRSAAPAARRPAAPPARPARPVAQMRTTGAGGAAPKAAADDWEEF